MHDNHKFHKPNEDLIAEFTSSGNLEALGELYSAYMHLVYGVCLKYLKNRDEAQDAVMNIFEKLIVEIPKQKIENFKGWLHVVTKNYCLMELRSGKSKNERHNEWVNESVIFMEIDPEMHPIDKDDNNLDARLKDCIERLKDEQKKCITMFYFENRCYNEIAATLETDEKKVKSHLQNGKRNLKLCLDAKK